VKIILFVLLGIFTIKKTKGQYTLRLIVNEAATKKQDDIYVAGTFNNWNPKDEKYKKNRLAPYGGLSF